MSSVLDAELNRLIEQKVHFILRSDPMRSWINQMVIAR
jgi:hypothetical protein